MTQLGGIRAVKTSRVLVAGTSTRAVAESAARAGFIVTGLDSFADLDQHPSVTALAVAGADNRPARALDLARASRTVQTDAVVYLSPFENAPAAVGELARGRTLWGNPRSVLRRARAPVQVMRRMRQRGFPTPSLVPPGQSHVDPSIDWLVKPRASGGGHGIRRWQRGTTVPPGWYLQEEVHGIPGSVTFVAAGGQCVVLGVSRQLVGEDAFGASGYRYSGNILVQAGDQAFGDDGRVLAAVQALAAAVVEEFGLIGVNGVDFVVRDGVPLLIEINPRWTASMELVERVSGTSVFAAHVRACTASSVSPAAVRPSSAAACAGKAVVYATSDVLVRDTRPWLADPTVRDVPRPGLRIAVGQPVCTVFATGDGVDACRDALVTRAAAVYAALRRM